jgi:hypothetical protein
MHSCSEEKGFSDASGSGCWSTASPSRQPINLEQPGLRVEQRWERVVYMCGTKTENVHPKETPNRHPGEQGPAENCGRAWNGDGGRGTRGSAIGWQSWGTERCGSAQWECKCALHEQAAEIQERAGPTVCSDR